MFALSPENTKSAPVYGHNGKTGSASGFTDKGQLDSKVSKVIKLPFNPSVQKIHRTEMRNKW